MTASTGIIKAPSEVRLCLLLTGWVRMEQDYVSLEGNVTVMPQAVLWRKRPRDALPELLISDFSSCVRTHLSSL